MRQETIPTNRRIYLTFAPAASGMAMVRFSYTPPALGTAFVAILSRGMILEGDTLAVPLVSDPTAVGALRGASAYEVARAAGYGGTTTQWLASLTGASGASAYELARAAGYGGTVTQWLTTLVGAKGADATDAQVATAVAAYMAAHPVAPLIGTATLTVTEAIAIAVGVHEYPVTLAGVAVGGALHLTPTAALPAGWAIHGAVVTTAGTMRVTVTTPLLGIGASVSIGLKVRRLNP